MGGSSRSSSGAVWDGHAELKKALDALATAKGVSANRVKAVATTASQYTKDYKRVVHDVEIFLWKADAEHRLAGVYAMDAIMRQSQAKLGSKDVFVKRFLLQMKHTLAAVKKIPTDQQASARHVIHEWQTRGYYTPEEIEQAGGYDFSLNNPQAREAAAAKPASTASASASSAATESNGAGVARVSPSHADPASKAKIASLLSMIKKQKELKEQEASEPALGLLQPPPAQQSQQHHGGGGGGEGLLPPPQVGLLPAPSQQRQLQQTGILQPPPQRLPQRHEDRRHDPPSSYDRDGRRLDDSSVRGRDRSRSRGREDRDRDRDERDRDRGRHHHEQQLHGSQSSMRNHDAASSFSRDRRNSPPASPPRGYKRRDPDHSHHDATMMMHESPSSTNNSSKSEKKARSSRWGPPRAAGGDAPQESSSNRPPAIETSSGNRDLDRSSFFENQSPRNRFGSGDGGPPPPPGGGPMFTGPPFGYQGGSPPRAPFRSGPPPPITNTFSLGPTGIHGGPPPPFGHQSTGPNFSGGAANRSEPPPPQQRSGSGTSAGSNAPGRDQQPGGSGEVCRKFLAGLCTFGDRCWHIHDQSASDPVRPRTEINQERRKTVLCANFPLGKCRFGDRCSFAHGEDDLDTSAMGSRRPPPHAASPHGSMENSWPPPSRTSPHSHSALAGNAYDRHSPVGSAQAFAQSRPPPYGNGVPLSQPPLLSVPFGGGGGGGGRGGAMGGGAGGTQAPPPSSTLGYAAHGVNQGYHGRLPGPGQAGMSGGRGQDMGTAPSGMNASQGPPQWAGASGIAANPSTRAVAPSSRDRAASRDEDEGAAPEFNLQYDEDD